MAIYSWFPKKGTSQHNKQERLSKTENKVTMAELMWPKAQVNHNLLTPVKTMSNNESHHTETSLSLSGENIELT